MPSSPGGPAPRTPGPDRPSPAPRRSSLRALGEWCARHSVLVIVLWLVALAGVQVIGRAVGGTFSDDFSLSNTQAQEGRNVLQEHEPSVGGTSAQVVLHDAQPLTTFQSQVDQAVGSLRQLPHVQSAQSPLPPQGQPPRPAARSPRTASPATSPSAST